MRAVGRVHRHERTLLDGRAGLVLDRVVDGQAGDEVARAVAKLIVSGGGDAASMCIEDSAAGVPISGSISTGWK